jgi:hypothetical protein
VGTNSAWNISIGNPERRKDIFCCFRTASNARAGGTVRLAALARLAAVSLTFAEATRTGDPASDILAGAHLYTWDNLDVRYADTTDIGGMPLVYGITANNNPTVQDPWNSTPAWGYPFVATNLANTPGAKTLIDQGFAAQVLGTGAYAFLND